MKQGVLIKFVISVILLSIYLFLYDPSMRMFLDSMKNLFNLRIGFGAIFCSVAWLFGFVGIISFFHNSNKKVRSIFWVIFMISYAVGFAYENIFNQAFSPKNISKFDDIFDNLNVINTASFLKFIVVSAVFYTSFKFLGSIGIVTNKYFIALLVLLAVCSVSLYSGSKMPMQIAYTVTFSALFGIILKLFSWLKLKLGFKFV
ncbi:MAG: hypothetical protein RLN62_00315 [Rickettsiales bacterium]